MAGVIGSSKATVRAKTKLLFILKRWAEPRTVECAL